jgi:hypothetical protein
MDRRELLKKAGLGSLALGSVPILGHALAGHASAAQEVRWDIIHIDPVPPAAGSAFIAGGEALAFATNPATPTIRLLGSGTFVSPDGGGPSTAVTGGGTWETFGEGLPAARGTFRVTHLVSWEFANLQAATPAFVDRIGNVAQRANGTAVLLIEYSDRVKGMLGIGCHGPGAPNGIIEGVIATKGVVTYWNAEIAPANVDKDRTLFHVL